MGIKQPGCIVRENVKAMQDKIRILLSKLFDENTVRKRPDEVNTMIYNIINFFGKGYKMVMKNTDVSEENMAYWNEIVKFSLGAVDYYFKKEVYLKTNSGKGRKKIDTVHVLQNTDLSPLYMGMPGSPISWFGSLLGIWIACAVRKIL